MIEEVILYIASILIVVVGIYIIARPGDVAERLKRFYSSYPIVRYAGDKQLSGRPAILRSAGLVIFAVGVICVLSI